MKKVDSMVRDKRGLIYKPFTLLIVANLVMKDQNKRSVLSVEQILFEFEKAMSNLNKDKSKKGYMPLWHLCTDSFWTLFKNNQKIDGQGMSKTNPKTNKRLLKIADEIRLDPLWNDNKQVQGLRFSCMKLLIEDYYENEDQLTRNIINFFEDEVIPGRHLIIGDRLIRDSKITREIKNIYDNKCQICQKSLEVPAPYEQYAEGAHIKPIGKPHDGPDKIWNILCLCPNHHVQFDYGYITIGENLNIISGDVSIEFKALFVNHEAHHIDQQMLTYHRENIFIDN